MFNLFRVLFIVLTFSAGASNATLLQVDGAGKLIGATGVIVDGVSYNVAFRDGTCIDLFNGCDMSTVFTFDTQAKGRAASLALLDQVFIDSFDSSPSLTAGCTHSLICWALTPYKSIQLQTGGIQVSTKIAANDYREFYDQAAAELTDYVIGRDTDLSSSANAYITFAVWTPAQQASVVPEPATLGLMVLGVAGLAMSRRRKGRK